MNTLSYPQPVSTLPYYAQPQLAPQGMFGSLFGGPLGGLMGGGIGGLFGNSNVGRQLGTTLGTIGGGFLPFSVDPATASYAQQIQQAQLAQQLAPQGFFGNQFGRSLPFSTDPATAAYAHQLQQAQLAQQLAPQGFFGNLLGQIGQPLGGAVGSIFGNPTLGGQIGNVAGQFGRYLPFSTDPATAAYLQQLQQAQQLQQLQQAQLAQQLGYMPFQGAPTQGTSAPMIH